MKFNLLFVCVALVSTFSSANLRAAMRNACDDLVDAKKPEEKIQVCLKRLGESDTYKSNIQQKKLEAEQNAIRVSEEAAKKANIETKSFSAIDLENQLGFPFYAFRIDYSKGMPGVEKRITPGDSLCKFLGYEKSLKVSISADIFPKFANKNGFVIGKNIIGIDKKPELFEDEGVEYAVRQYNEITCAKVISKDIVGTDEALRKQIEAISHETRSINTSIDEDLDSEIDDSPRRPANKKSTQHGYKGIPKDVQR